MDETGNKTLTINELFELKQRLTDSKKMARRCGRPWAEISFSEIALIKDFITENIHFREHYKKEKGL